MRRLPIICLLLLPLWSCSSALPTHAHFYAAQAVLKTLTEGVKEYFTADQRYVEAEPWHPIPDDKGPSCQGLFIPWVQYTFPGGTNFTMSSHPAPPQGGEPVMPSPSSSSDHMQATLNRLRFAWPNYPTHFQYTYETGPGRGAQSTATITARANFDTSNEALYTMTIRVEVDAETQEVNILPFEIKQESE